MTAFEAGIYKFATEQGYTEGQALDLLKIAMGFSGATPLFDHPNMDGQADPNQLHAMAAMQQQVEHEKQMQMMQHQMMQSQQMAQAPVGVQ